LDDPSQGRPSYRSRFHWNTRDGNCGRAYRHRSFPRKTSSSDQGTCQSQVRHVLAMALLLVRGLLMLSLIVATIWQAADALANATAPIPRAQTATNNTRATVPKPIGWPPRKLTLYLPSRSNRSAWLANLVILRSNPKHMRLSFRILHPIGDCAHFSARLRRCSVLSATSILHRGDVQRVTAILCRKHDVSCPNLLAYYRPSAASATLVALPSSAARPRACRRTGYISCAE
jgi:hypothetical protein